MYTWGRGDDGRLGHGDNGWKYVPRVVEALEGQRIVQVRTKNASLVCLAKTVVALRCALLWDNVRRREEIDGKPSSLRPSGRSERVVFFLLLVYASQRDAPILPLPKF